MHGLEKVLVDIMHFRSECIYLGPTFVFIIVWKKPINSLIIMELPRMSWEPEVEDSGGGSWLSSLIV